MKFYIYILTVGLFLYSCGENTQEQPLENLDKEKAETTVTDIEEPTPQLATTSLEDNFTVAGTIENGIHTKLVVEANTPQGPVIVGETFADDKGNFNIKGNITDMGLYQLRVVEKIQNPNTQAEKAVPLTLLKKDSVYITVDFENFNKAPSYSGAVWTDPLNGYFSKLFDFIEFQRNLKNPEKMSQTALVALIDKKKAPLDKFCKAQIEKDPDNPANLILMKELYPIEYLGGFKNWDKTNIKTLKTMQDGYNQSYPSNPISNQIMIQVNQLENGYNEYVSFAEMKIAPEISLKDPSGKVRNLSDLRGKVVLIDFWASWCGPCRRENPNVVKMYKKYKEKGFEIFSVSLDNDKNAWKRAIDADGLLWENHVSDLQGWKSSVVNTYKFQGIPYTVLIDKNGKIIEKGLRGQGLERKLETLLK